MATRPWDFAFATLVSFLVNLFCYLAIKYVSATSFKVAGCMKNVLVVWGGIMQGDVVTIQELQVSLRRVCWRLIILSSPGRGVSAVHCPSLLPAGVLASVLAVDH